MPVDKWPGGQSLLEIIGHIPKNALSTLHPCEEGDWKEGWMMGGPQHEARVIRLNHEILEAITLPYPILCVQHLD